MTERLICFVFVAIGLLVAVVDLYNVVFRRRMIKGRFNRKYVQLDGSQVIYHALLDLAGIVLLFYLLLKYGFCIL